MLFHRIILSGFMLIGSAICCYAMPSDAHENYRRMDKEMGVLYNQLINSLKSRSPKAAEELRQAELSWIRFRDQECKPSGYRKHLTAHEGFSGAYCLEELTAQRLETIKRAISSNR